MIGIIYASNLVGFSFEEMDDILATSERNNSRDCVSGALVYNTSFALQCLEGDPALVKATFERICADERHDKIKLLSVRNIDARRFPDWSMSACVVEGETLRSLKLIAHIPLVGFNLRAWSEQDANRFIDALSEYMTQTRPRETALIGKDDTKNNPGAVAGRDAMHDLEQRLTQCDT